MNSFETIQQALSYTFGDKHVSVLNIPNSPYPWFIAHEIKNAIEWNPNKDTMDIIESVTLYDDLVNEAMNMFGYKFNKYYEKWEK